MAEEESLIEYSIMDINQTIGSSRKRLRVYLDGRVEVREFTYLDEDKNGIVLRELKIPTEQVNSYINKLVQADFFNFQNIYNDSMVFDGLEESITFNYKGKSKTITCLNKHPSSEEFEKVIVDLERLVSE